MEILIIDDEQPTLRMFRLLLEGLGHTVFTADTGEAGIQQLQDHPVPLVLTDIKMPQMDGIEVLEEVKKQHAGTEVIVITGHGDMELALEALNLDATDFINKPLRREQLEAAIARAEERLRHTGAAASLLEVEERDEEVVIRLCGALGTSSEGALRDAFKQVAEGEKPLLLKFDETTSVNGGALSVLGDCIRQIKDDCAEGVDRPISIEGVSQNFRDVFIVMGISNLVTLM